MIQSFPIYVHIVESIDLFDQGDKTQCVRKLMSIQQLLQDAFKRFYQTFVTEKVSEKVWLNHVQGFQGWAAGKIENGTYIQYDGVQGGQTLMMQVIDAFLGMDAFLSDDASHRNVPYYQRQFVEAIRRHNFRSRALKAGDQDIEQCMGSISRSVQVRVALSQLLYGTWQLMWEQIFRISHRRTARKYLGADAPERKFMTSGKSVFQDLQEAAEHDPLDHVGAILTERLEQTKQSPRVCS